jgi:hypothetical protein
MTPPSMSMRTMPRRLTLGDPLTIARWLVASAEASRGSPFEFGSGWVGGWGKFFAAALGRSILANMAMPAAKANL